MKLFFLIISLTLTLNGIGQIESAHYFNDTINGKLNQIHSYIEVEDGVIIAGEVNVGAKEYTVIIKISPQGERVWSTINSNVLSLSYFSCSGFSINLFKDGFIYGVSKHGNNHIIWKINPNDGEVIYTKSFHLVNSMNIELDEYDSSKFIASYARYEGGYNYAMLAYMSKTTGDTLSTRDMGVRLTFESGVTVDANQNVYFWKDNKLMKFNRGSLNQKLWERTYQAGFSNPLDIIQEVYLDNEERVFVFGIDGGSYGHGDGNVSEISPLDGSSFWNIQGYSGQVRLIQIIDRDEKLYMCYQHSLVGASYTRYFACRIDKASGTRDWYCFHNMTPVGSPTSSNGGMQAPLSMDLDCEGGLYMTGYYGSANYGPGVWGVMKVNANTGDKLYDFTVTEDSTNFNTFSVGKVLCVFGNSPIVLGHLQNLNSPNSGRTDAYYVAFDPQSGAILDRRGISGQFQLQSKTIDIIRKDSIMYVYKQQGKYLALQALDDNFNQIWSQTIADTSLLIAGNMTVTPNFVYVTSHKNYTGIFYPYDLGIAFRYYVKRINRFTGEITHDTYGSISSGSTFSPMEIEAEDDRFNFFYRVNSTEYIASWTTTSGYGNVAPLNLGGNSQLFEGTFDNVLNYNATHVIVIGSDAIRQVQKTNGWNSTVLHSFANNRIYYDHEFYQNRLYSVGSTENGEKLFTVYDIIGDSIVWENTYGSGRILKIEKDPYNNFIIGGERDSLVSTAMVKRINGDIIWERYLDTLSFPSMQLIDCKINSLANVISVSGAVYNDDGSTDVIISQFNYYGDSLFSFLGLDVQDLKSTGYTIEEAPDSTTWIGGSFNRLTTVKEGFISKLSTQYCGRFVQGNGVSCSNETDTLVAWEGNSYQWYLNGVLLPDETSQTITNLANGNYNVIVNDACGIDSMIYAFENLIIPLPIVDLPGNDNYCEGDSLQLLVSNQGSYQWFMNGVTIPDAINNSIYVNNPGIYNVLVTDEYGCSDSATVGSTITILSIPMINFSVDPNVVCDNNSPINLSADPAGGIFIGFGVNNSEFNPVLSGVGDFVIEYTFTNEDGCSASLSDTITVLESTSSTLEIFAIDSYTLNGQTYTSSGTYQQVLTNISGCDSTLILILELEYTGLNEVHEWIEIQPNPSNGLYHLTFNSIPNEDIKIYDATGRKLSTSIATQLDMIIDLTEYPSGAYFLHLDGYTVRLIKE
jgi:hypothetical protein